MPLKMTWVVTDFETASALNLKKVGAHRYGEDASTEVLCFNWSHMGQPWRSWTPYSIDPDAWETLHALIADDSVMFVSFGDFERVIWKKIMQADFGFPPLPDERWHDIQASAAMHQMPKDLETLLLVLGLGIEKDMEGNKLTLGLSKPDKKGTLPARTPAVIQRVQQYCGSDVDGEVAAHKALGWLQKGERRYWLLNQQINQRGIALDLDFISACKEVADKASVPLIAEFRKLTGVKPSQRDKFMDWMATHGVNLPNLTKETMNELFGEHDDDEEQDDDAEGYLPTLVGLELPPDVHRALSIRKLVGSTSLSKLDAMERCVCADGRAHGLLQYHGTGPGRSAGRLLQPQNFPKPTVKASPERIVEAIMTRDYEWVECMVGPAIPTVVSGLRQAITCEKGRVLISGDYSGIQARLVLAVAGQMDKVALMASGADVYSDMASLIFKFAVNKDDHPKERGVGKNSVLGLGFQMGPPTFQVKYCRDRHIDFCKNVVRVYRKEWAPKVPPLWYGLEDAATRAVWTGEAQEAYGVVYALEGRWLTCTLPSGRKIYYFNPKPSRRPAPWDPDEIKEGFTYQAQKNHVWRTIDAFGGQLAENVIMGMEADIMRAAQFKLEANGFPIVLEVHDEIIAEPMKADADQKAFDQIMMDVDPWVKAVKVPIAVEGWIAERYRK